MRASSRPKIYFNGKFYGGALNGVARVADRLIRQVDALAGEGAASGWDMRLLVPAKGDWAPELRHIRKAPQRRGHTQFWEQALLPWVARDGILVSLANLAPALHARKITMVHDVQFLISPESYPLKLRLGYRALIPLGARTSRTVLTVSDYARDSLVSHRLAARERIVVIRNAAEHIAEAVPDETALVRLGLEAGRFCLVFGSVAAYKNVQVVFDAFRTAPAGLKLVVIGPDAAALRKGGLVPPEGAVFAGPIDDTILRALYEAAACLLFPSRTEGFGLPPLEAMTCGCPVVSAPAGAMPEICRDAILYADASDPADWAAAIARIVGSPDVRREKIAVGRERARHFTWRRSAEQLIAQIAEVAEG